MAQTLTTNTLGTRYYETEYGVVKRVPEHQRRFNPEAGYHCNEFFYDTKTRTWQPLPRYWKVDYHHDAQPLTISEANQLIKSLAPTR